MIAIIHAAGMGRRRNMQPAESRIMAAKIVAGKAANAIRRIEEDRHRLSCPLEQAKTFLRQRGFHVFAESVLSWNLRHSRLIIVGRTPMEAADVIEMAERIRARITA